MKTIRLYVLIAFSLIATGARGDKAFLGPIPVQYVASGKEVVLDMHRFWQPGDAGKLEFTTKDDVDIAFDSAAFVLRARPTKAGISEVEISVPSESGKLSTVLTIAVEAGAPSHHFVFKPAPPETTAATTHKVFLAGSFNGWSTDKTPMTGPNEKGEYTADLALQPGRYPYKFVVDGTWTVDPANSQSEDDGSGHKNSVAVVSGAKKSETPPVIYAEQFGDLPSVPTIRPDHSKGLTVRAVSKSKIGRASAVLEKDNGSISIPAVMKSKVGYEVRPASAVPSETSDPDSPSPTTIEVALTSEQSGFLRVIAATADGEASNVVRVPVGASAKAFHWEDAVMYYAFTDRFADGDKSNDKPVENSNVLPPANYHGGDLRGIRDKIENGYFESLGVNTVWVAPLNRNPEKAYQESPEPHRWYTGYHGYWPVSSTELDPHIGTAKDLNALVESAHSHGMKVIADLVLHHVHEEHPWWKQHRDWFGVLDLPDGRKNLRLWDEQQFTTWFEPYLPSFDFSKDAPVKALIDNSIWWLNTYKLDGFRLDAVKHILPSFWWKFRAALREGVDRKGKSPLYLVGETFKDRAGIMSFVGPNMLDGQFDFPLYDQIKDTFALTKDDMKTLDEALTASERTYGKETLMSPLVGNHDKGRFMAYADGDLPDPKIDKEEEVGWKKPPKVDDGANYKKLELAQAFLMAIDGVPMIYYGDEMGMTGAGDPDNRRDMRFDKEISPEEKHVLENFKKLGAIRRTHPALRSGSRRTLRVDKDIYAISRAYLNDRVVVIFNRGKTPATIDLNVSPELGDGDYAEAIRGTAAKVKDGKLKLELPAQTAGFVTRK